MRFSILALWALGLLSATVTLGCKKEAADAPAEPAAADTSSTDSSATGAAATDETDVFAALSETDRAAALAQKICPVTGDPLGGPMGTPVKVTVEGREVFICCEGCRDAIEAEPSKYLATLDAPAGGNAATQ